MQIRAENKHPSKRRAAIFETLESRQFLTGVYHLTYDDEFNSLKLSTYTSSGQLVNTDPANSGYLTRDTLDNAATASPRPETRSRNITSILRNIR